MRQRARVGSLTICYREKQIDADFHHNIVKVVCRSTQLTPRGSTPTLTMLWQNSWLIIGQTHGKLTSICFIVLLENTMGSWKYLLIRKVWCLKWTSPVPELSFLPAPYRGWTRAGERRVQGRVQDNLHAHAQNKPIKNYQLPTHSRPQSLRSFRPAAGIESSGSNHFGHAP